MSGPHWTDNGKFKAWSFFAGDDVLVITTSSPDFTDDIALQVGADAKEAVRAHVPRIKGISIADGHNCINGKAVSVMPGDLEAIEYTDTVTIAVTSNVEVLGRPISIGMYQVILDDVQAKEGIGPGGVTALVVRSGNDNTVLISIDGNNMESGMREEIQEMLRAEGFSQSEAVTTDTHLVNAISLSSRGYPPVGRYRREETMRAILEAAKRAREIVTPVNVGMGFGEMKGLRTFGEKGFDTLTHDIVEGAAIAKRIGLRVAGIMFLAISLLAFLL